MCSLCLSTGYVLCRFKKADVPTIPFAFRCECMTGRAKASTGIPLWGRRYEGAYEPIRSLAYDRPKDETPAHPPQVPLEPSLSAAEDALPW